jgi:hypothetical protein
VRKNAPTAAPQERNNERGRAGCAPHGLKLQPPTDEEATMKTVQWLKPKGSHRLSDLERRRSERKVDVEGKVSEERKQHNARRFMWHERLIKAGKLPIAVVRLAGLIMHKRMLTTHGYVALSAKDMADELGITERGAQKARDRLMAAGWIEQVPFRGQRKARYRTTFPPSTVH